jgi:phosphatidylcholine synthase
LGKLSVVDADLSSGDRTWLKQVRAFSIHLLTASGAALALFALIAAADWRWTEMFAWLALALLVDGVDGFLARKLKISETLPRWSGEALDLVVDFSTYALIPAFAIVAGAILPQAFEIPAAAAIVISSAIYFADRRMKTDDSYFRGFPAVWNLVAFYLFLLRPEPWLALIVIGVFIVLTFIPVAFIHPLRVKKWRVLNIALSLVWAALATFTLMRELAAPAWTIAGLVVIGFYFLTAGLARSGKI